MNKPIFLVCNIHQYVKNPEQCSHLETVKGNYEFYHFGESGVDDRGWGCAYRSLQTVCSWLHLQGMLQQGSVPSHQQIQQVLKSSVDGYKGGHEWIGSWELFMFLDVCHNISSKILNSNSTEEFVAKFQQLHAHFKQGGSPIMIGEGSYANIILGVCKDGNGEQMMLILDPHYYGIDDPQQIIQQGYCKWMSMKVRDERTGSFNNLLLPQVYFKQQ
eukprot:TRINITY_DN8738_c0_g1_i4.p1 TRINITY_DN8738_c0_g1~~TRINITY_DN8738_c0_g1_i4.p1  ORF type:complete len:223 (-),score=16.10 TRINITY_DN8738_c0_g1_i4:190-837(-)